MVLKPSTLIAYKKTIKASRGNKDIIEGNVIVTSVAGETESVFLHHTFRSLDLP